MSDSKSASPLTSAALALLGVGLFVLIHPYRGLVHDARLYTLQALNHLHPELFLNDVFLKYGSQDSYTLFTPIYAAAISLLGTEPAACLLTSASVLALLVASWLLARSLMSAPFAWLGLGIFVAVPSFYGSGVTFAVLESFITPRLLSEALVLFALTAWLRNLPSLSLISLFCGFLIHPLMAFPAAIVIVLMNWGTRYWRAFLQLAIGGLLLGIAALIGWLPITSWQLDDAWWPMAERVPHLVLHRWTVHDWARIGTLFATLGIAAICLHDSARRLVAAVLVTCALTLLLSWIGGDLLRVALIVQGQAWRSLWIATTFSALLLPWVVASCWRDAPLRQCGASLLVAAWIIGPTSIALALSVPAFLAVAYGRVRVSEQLARLVIHFGRITLAVCILCVLSLAWSKQAELSTSSNTLGWLESIRTLSQEPLLPAFVLLGVWLASRQIRSCTAAGLLLLAVAIPATVVISNNAESWLKEDYPREAKQAFAAWRQVIPQGSDVLWATRFVSGGDPMAVWLLLERPSYYSSVQVNSGLFSREAAMELRRRGKMIPLSLPTELPFDIVFGGHLGQVPSCKDIPVPYVVTDVPIRDAQVIQAPPSVGPPFNKLELRLCTHDHAPDVE
jgi:hypothetical protein